MVDDELVPVEFDGAAGPGVKVRVDAATVRRVVTSTPIGGRPTCYVYSENGSGHVFGTPGEIEERLDAAFGEPEPSSPARP